MIGPSQKKKTETLGKSSMGRCNASPLVHLYRREGESFGQITRDKIENC
jgi:hypothetical protein